MWNSPEPDMLQTSAVRGFDLERPVELVPVTVEKPWGHEVWYSGVEARGESGVSQDGRSARLSEYLEAAGIAEVVLLKELHATDGRTSTWRSTRSRARSTSPWPRETCSSA